MVRRLFVAILLVMAEVTAPKAAVAQSVCTGCRVRVAAPALMPGRVEGRVELLGPDTLEFPRFRGRLTTEVFRPQWSASSRS